jgi:hypothetical protein
MITTLEHKEFIKCNTLIYSPRTSLSNKRAKGKISNYLINLN